MRSARLSAGEHGAGGDVFENNKKTLFNRCDGPVQYQPEFVVCIDIPAPDGLESARSESLGPEYCHFDPLVDNGLQRGLQRALSHEGP